MVVPIQNESHEILIHAGGYPGSTGIHIDVGIFHGRRHNGFQCFHIVLVVRINAHKAFHHPQLGSDIAAQILGSGDQISVLVLEDKPLVDHLAVNAFHRLAGQPCNHGGVHGAYGVQTDGQTFFHGIRLGCCPVGGDGVLGEDVCLGCRCRCLSCLGAVIFQTQDGVPVCKGFDGSFVLGGIQISVLIHKPVVLIVQLLPEGIDNLLAGTLLQGITQFRVGIPDSYHTGDTVCGILVHFQFLKLSMLVLGVDNTVLDRQSLRPFLGIGLLPVGCLRADRCGVFHLCLNRFHCLPDLVSQGASVLVGVHGHLVTVQATAHCGFAQNHIRVVCKILIDGSTIAPGDVFKTFAGVLRLCIPLLQNQNIGHNGCSCISRKGGVGKADCAQKICTLHDVFPNGIVSAVHGVVGGNEHGQSSGTNLVQCLCKEIVVNGAGNGFRVVLIGNAVIAEGNIADSHIHIAIRDVGFLKSLDPNIGIGVEVLRNLTGNAVQFHHGPAFHSGRHIRRHSTHEVTNTGRGFQHSAAGESQMLKSRIHCLDNLDAGVVGVLGAFSGCLVLSLCQHFSQFLELCFQTADRFIFQLPGGTVGNRLAEGICQTAPAHILGEGFLFCCGSIPAFCCQLLHNPDGLNIGSGSGLGAIGKIQAVTDHEIAALGCLSALLFDLLLHFLVKLFFLGLGLVSCLTLINGILNLCPVGIIVVFANLPQDNWLECRMSLFIIDVDLNDVLHCGQRIHFDSISLTLRIFLYGFRMRKRRNICSYG